MLVKLSSMTTTDNTGELLQRQTLSTEMCEGEIGSHSVMQTAVTQQLELVSSSVTGEVFLKIKWQCCIFSTVLDLVLQWNM